jgi:hypothetical protein
MILKYIESAMYAAEILSPEALAPFGQIPNLRIVIEPMPQISQEARGIGTSTAVGQGVVHPETVFLPAHEAGILQDLHMLGDSGLGDPKGGLDLADTHHPLLKHLEKPHPVGVGQRLHDLDEFFHGLFAILLVGNIVIASGLVKKILQHTATDIFAIRIHPICS